MPNLEFTGGKQMSKEIFKVNNSASLFQDQVKVTNLTFEDVEQIGKINNFIEKHCDEIIDQFYEKILSVPHLKQLIENHSSLEKLKKTLKKHIQTMFTKDLDDEYLAERNQIALIHYLIKLDPKWYIAAFQHLNNCFHLILAREIESKEEVTQLSSIISKYISLEMQIVLEAYETKVLTNMEIDDLLRDLDAEKLGW
jgi:heme-based aerotactic transducer